MHGRTGQCHPGNEPQRNVESPGVSVTMSANHSILPKVR